MAIFKSNHFLNILPSICMHY